MLNKTSTFPSFSRLMNRLFPSSRHITGSSEVDTRQQAIRLMEETLARLQSIDLPEAKKAFEEVDGHYTKLSAERSRRSTAERSNFKHLRRLKADPEKFDAEFPKVSLEELAESQRKFLEARNKVTNIEKQISDLQFLINKKEPTNSPDLSSTPQNSSAPAA